VNATKSLYRVSKETVQRLWDVVYPAGYASDTLLRKELMFLYDKGLWNEDMPFVKQVEAILCNHICKVGRKAGADTYIRMVFAEKKWTEADLTRENISRLSGNCIHFPDPETFHAQDKYRTSFAMGIALLKQAQATVYNPDSEGAIANEQLIETTTQRDIDSTKAGMFGYSWRRKNEQ